jgi:hypothetical protein
MNLKMLSKTNNFETKPQPDSVFARNLRKTSRKALYLLPPGFYRFKSLVQDAVQDS